MRPNPFHWISPLALGTYSENLHLFREHKVGWKWYNFGKRAMVQATSGIVRQSIARDAKDNLEQILETQVSAGPLFIIGHYRSGTTLLHNLLACDEQFSWLSFRQALCIKHFLCPSFLNRVLLPQVMPRRRPHDHVSIGAQLPQEDEFAFSNYSRHSTYHGFLFPRAADFYFKKYLDPAGLPEVERQEWIDQANYIYRKISFRSRDKMILSKNPPHTSRIRFIKQIYPKAKFIYLLREPLEVYGSSLAFFSELLSRFSFQSYDLVDYADNIRNNYKLLLENVVRDAVDLGDQEFVAVHYSDLVNNPQAVLAGIYRSIGLSGYENARESFEDHLETMYQPKVKTYSKNAAYKDLIESEWRPIYDEQVANLPFVKL